MDKAGAKYRSVLHRVVAHLTQSTLRIISMIISAPTRHYFPVPQAWQDYIKSRDTVAGNHNKQFVINGVNIAHFAVVNCGLVGEGEVGGGEVRRGRQGAVTGDR